LQLIRKIEISYLRSLYRANIDHPGDLNIIFGRNDSGKSNLLRALNLFFNGEISPNNGMDFSLDFSDIRRLQAKELKGRQFIAIRIDFNIPQNYRKSLGETISIKKQWNIYGGVTETLPKDLSTGSKIQLSKFLNQIDFTYIPAIKDIEVFSDLIGRVYSTTASSTNIRNATDSFVDSIREQTSDLSAALSKIFSSPTQVAAPTDMELMFRSLDFSHGEDRHSLLKQKGDGVKARHLPELLRHINKNESDKRYFIWGFEEPENSLDFGAAESEAKNFSEISSRTDTQVFITSHSPAFYLAESEKRDHVVSRFFVSKQSADIETGDVNPKNALSRIDDLDSAEETMKGASLLQLPFIIRRWKDLRDENYAIKIEKERIEKQLNALKMPTLFVEGNTDRLIFEDSFSRLGTLDRLAVKTLDGSPRTTAALIQRIAQTGGLPPETPVVFLFDNDQAGRAAYKNLCEPGKPGVSPHKFAENLSAWVLPVSEEIKSFSKKYGIQDNLVIATIEFLYDGKGAAELCEIILSENQKEDMNATIHDSFHRNLSQKNSRPLRDAKPGSRDWLWSRGVPDAVKNRFAEMAIRELASTRIDEVAKRIISELKL